MFPARSQLWTFSHLEKAEWEFSNLKRQSSFHLEKDMKRQCCWVLMRLAHGPGWQQTLPMQETGLLRPPQTISSIFPRACGFQLPLRSREAVLELSAAL
jgi:hypothetical protein